MSLEVNHQPLAGSRLVSDYLHERGEAASFFASPPFSMDAYRHRWSELRARFGRRHREAAAVALHPTSETARRRLEEWIEIGGAVVTTGQQAGLFTGPLYTIYKALTTARLAKELESRLGVPVLPVFWTASEDHDWEEVNHTYLIDRDDSLRRLEIPASAQEPLPMSERRIVGEVEEVIRQAAQVLTGDEHGSRVIELVREAYVPGRTVADAFRSLLAPLLSPFDFLLADAADPALKRASLPVLQRELHEAREHERLLLDTARQLEGAAYPVQVPVLPAASNLFLRTTYGRERLFRDARGWVSRETGARFTTSELQSALETDGSSFSPNVLLRPVVESYVFPVLAYVAGPGELAYWAQVRPLFVAHGVGMPAVYPRASMTLIEPRTKDLLQRLDLPLADLRLPRHELVSRHTRISVPPRVERTIRRLREGVIREFDHLAASAAALDATLTGAIGARRNRAMLEIQAAERQILRSVARAEHEWSTVLDRAVNHLFPLGRPQERVLNLLPYLARYGTPLLRRIADGIEVPLREAEAPAISPAHPA